MHEICVFYENFYKENQPMTIKYQTIYYNYSQDNS